MAMLADTVELARRGRHPQGHPHRRGRPGSQRRGHHPGDRAGHPGRLLAAAAIGRPTRRSAGVGDRRHRRLWRRPHSLPARPWRAGAGAGPAKRAARRHGARSDPLDATRAAREALGRDQLAQPRAAGHRAALSVRLTARRSAVQAATDAQRQLHALVVAAPDTLRERLRGLSTPRLVATCGRLRLRSTWDTETIATAASLRALARRIQLLNAEIADHSRAITTLVRAWRPELLTPCGVDPIVAAVVLCARSHAGRCRTDAAFAMLGGAAPIPASSGQTVRVRLNRSGDRQLNQALHLIVLTRLRYDPATRAYAQRRRAEGKTNREIRRCLARYVARQLYRLLEAQPTLRPT
jgi:transposase